MQHPPTADIEALLRELLNAGPELIVVGGAAAVMHGAPINTHDLDIVPRQESVDLERLLAVLGRLNARFRPWRPDRDLVPTAEHLAGTGQLQLITKLGPLDILLRLHDGRGFTELVSHTQTLDAGDLRIRVIDLETLIEIKRGTGRARDALALPILLALRDKTAK